MRALAAEDPERVGDYSLVGRLGRGAMGTVYLACSPGGRPVAVKVARPELAADPLFRDRFRHEVAMARAVGGFWTAAVVDADPDAAQPWLATEYVPGPTLFEAVTTHGGLPEPALCRLVAGLAEALAAIHAAGLVHRDLKPSNVLLAADGPRVIDFGIAKAVQSAGLTATGMVVGTPGFLSPEQIEGGEVGPPSDVFALGSILVFAATGHGPFGEGDVASLVYRAVHTQPNLDGLPDGLRALAARCLRSAPGDRPTPAELLAGVGQPQTAEWLPAPLRSMVDRHQTELLAPPAAPRDPTREYTRAAEPRVPPADSRAVFRTSRRSALVFGLFTAVLAVWCLSVSGSAAERHNSGPALLFFCFFGLSAVAAGRLFWRLLRPQPWVEVSGAGITVGRGPQRRELAWPQIARVRVVADRLPWLVVWLRDPELSTAGLGKQYPGEHGGFRVFPVGHERARPARNREVRELAAALRWYGSSAYDSGLR